MMYRIVYRIVALVPRYVSVAKKMYRCSPRDLVTHMRDWEMRYVSRRLLDSLGEVVLPHSHLNLNVV